MTDKANIADFLPEMAERQPDATAIVCPWGRRGGSLTYSELNQRSARIARGLEEVGIGHGVRTILMVPPGLDLFPLAFGLFRSGAVPVLVDPGIGLKHLKTCIGNAEPEAFIGVPRAHAARVILGWSRPTIQTNITVGRRVFWGGYTLAQIEAMGSDANPRKVAVTAADDVAAVVFTSGSTGPPKGVVYRHSNFAAQVDAIRDAYGIEPGEVNLPTFPLFALFDPALGMTTVVPDMDPTRPARVDPRKIIGPIKEHGVTIMFGSPALLDTVGRWGAANGVTLDSLRCVISAGAPVPPRVIERFQGLLGEGAAIHTPYGATESLPVASASSQEILLETRYATDRGAGTCVGYPVPSIEAAVIAINDEPISTWRDDLKMEEKTVGEIVVKGPQVTREYFKAPVHTSLAKIADGDTVRHRMGDLGYFDESGRLWFCGRKSQRVETRDGTLFTVPCESVFNTHPEVFRTALVGVGERNDQTPVLCVELEKGVGRSEHERIRQQLLDLGAEFEHTRQIHTVIFHPGFPVDIRHNAKIGRGALAEWATPRVGS
ncbi:MAG: AMP-binding protein [Acidobacteria bacterium]|jgi:acyl-CoA synthetase (AMP-forming)/AMP-acid ligase II|nr:AMP-binding protein [Acidobacteriota bacterium]